MAVKKRRRYTDEERATLMVMLQSEGYPGKLGALQKVADYANIQPNVLRRWWQAKQNPPPNELVTRKKIELREAIEEELTDIFEGMKAKRDDASYKDLGTVAGILFDKKQLLDNKPTERIALDHSGQLTIEERRQRITDVLNADQELRRITGLSTPDD